MDEPSPPGGRGKRRRDQGKWTERRDGIVDVAATLFARNGYHNTSLTELCAAVGLEKGSLYYYINSKENLLILIHDRVMTEVIESAMQAAAAEGPPVERLKHLGTSLIHIITKYPDHVWVFLHEWRALSDEKFGQFRESRRIYEDVVGEILSEGSEDGSMRIGDLKMYVLAWLNLHNYTYIWHRSEGRMQPADIAAVYHEIFTHGVLTHMEGS